VEPTVPGIDALIEAVEFRGHDFFGSARNSAGDTLFFRAKTRLVRGEAVRLSAPPSRVLIYPEA
jgi:hypothetical protein